MTTKVTMHCPECGSQNIGIDAVAKWSVATQEWVLAGTHDCITCNDCDAEFDGANTEEVQPATLAREQAAGGK